MSRTLGGLLLSILVSGTPVFAQGSSGAGKLELSLIPGGWVSFAAPDTRPEPAFGQFLFGGAFTVNWSMIGIEADLFMAPGRSQTLEFGATSRSQKAPHVVLDSVNLIVPLTGNSRTIVPFVVAGIGEVTIMRTSDDVLQPDTETFTAGDFGAGVKWYGEGRWGIRADYRFTLVRSKFDAPGSFFGRELRKAQRFSGGLVINLIPR